MVVGEDTNNGLLLTAASRQVTFLRLRLRLRLFPLSSSHETRIPHLSIPVHPGAGKGPGIRDPRRHRQDVYLHVQGGYCSYANVLYPRG